jgi:DNA-binding GntR family transcriptional regulator
VASQKTRSKPRHGSLAQQAYAQIRERILTGDLPIGSELSRRKLAIEYGMSSVPMTEALQKLENEGLVESKPRVGTRVRVPSASDIREQYVMREALECQSARLFCEKASIEEKRELAIIARRLDELDEKWANPDRRTKEVQIAEKGRLHMHLHVRLAECTGCNALVKAIEFNQTLVFKWLLDTAYQRPALPARWHQQLIELVSDSDPDEAEAAMRQHVRHGLHAVLEVLTPVSASDALNGNRFSFSRK